MFSGGIRGFLILYRKLGLSESQVLGLAHLRSRTRFISGESIRNQEESSDIVQECRPF